jgi:hypothetical protein
VISLRISRELTCPPKRMTSLAAPETGKTASPHRTRSLMESLLRAARWCFFDDLLLENAAGRAEGEVILAARLWGPSEAESAQVARAFVHFTFSTSSSFHVFSKSGFSGP